MRSTLVSINLVFVLLSFVSFAKADISNDFESLGSNKKLVKRAKAYNSNRKVRIVQRRTVDRNWRLEFGITGGLVAGGNAYLETEHIGGLIDLHITPRVSIGARYNENYNSLTAEGKDVFTRANTARVQNNNFDVPDVDVPLNTTLAVISFYPLYGKVNMFDMGVAQFDVYGLAGYGQTKLESGTSPTITAGGGIGLWLAQHFSARFELRWENYQDQVFTGSRDLNLTTASASIGFML